MRPSLALSIPQPCSESWDAMTPTAAGRHCAACQKTVVDFTQKTDAELLAYFAQPSSNTCGRFWDDQLSRPLRLPVAPLAGSRWRTWLAAAATVWGLREATAWQATASSPTVELPPKKVVRATSRPALRIRGVVRDASTNEPVPGVAVFLKNENRHATTDSAGRFSLRVPAGRTHHALVLHAFGYYSKKVAVPPAAKAVSNLAIALRTDGAASGAEVTGYATQSRRQITGGAISIIDAKELGPSGVLPAAAPDAKHGFWYWLTRSFRRRKATN
ncbi:carboxypeptidase-like regulatory domain-containing protein [Hymenobacter negativus]|uniref:Carboxypeptidase-like regulatory domain-containing protein n=1 Tax=Hymenobacter negativus TaxID=2795026 RepID=A0ABS3QHX2_9BACT|nr:carboxypeptidase-like regulatory domain-containing protein [Hymenobacter negativus]MBO2010389.1 carboxypeptidase-like regulatory domain-containing protein [Hymenobacter negativus]